MTDLAAHATQVSRREFTCSSQLELHALQLVDNSTVTVQCSLDIIARARARVAHNAVTLESRGRAAIFGYAQCACPQCSVNAQARDAIQAEQSRSRSKLKERMINCCDLLWQAWHVVSLTAGAGATRRKGSLISTVLRVLHSINSA